MDGGICTKAVEVLAWHIFNITVSVISLTFNFLWYVLAFSPPPPSNKNITVYQLLPRFIDASGV